MKKAYLFCAIILWLLPVYVLSQPVSRADFTWDWEGPEAGITWKIGVDPANDDLALAVSEGSSLWRTVDGSSWILISDFRYSTYRIVLYAAPDTALAVRNDTLFFTQDGGNNWYPSPTPFNSIDGLSEQVNRTVYLSDHINITDAHALFHSDDCGMNWTLIDTIFGHEKFYCIRFDPSNDSIIYYAARADQGSIDTTVILRSMDMGASWTRIFEQSSSFPVAGIADIEINPYNSNEIFVCGGFDSPGAGPLYSSNGGNTWEWMPTALLSGLILPYDVEFSDSDTVLITNMFPPGIFKGIHYPAVGWQFFRTDSAVAFTDVELTPGGTYYAGTLGDGIYKSTNSGSSWFPVNTNLKAHFAGLYAGENVSECIGTTLYTKSVYSTPLFKTTNGGLSWQKSYCPWLLFANSIEAAPSNADIVYIGGFGGEYSFPDTLFFSFFRSTDGGQTWTPMDTIAMPQGDPSTWFRSIWISSTDASRLLSMHKIDDTTTILIRSTNGGASWDSLFNIAQHTSIVGTDTVFVDADSVLYVSLDRGDTWQPLAYNLHIHEMAYNPENHSLYIVHETSSGDSLSSIALSGNITHLTGITGGMYCLSTPGANSIYLSCWLNYIPVFVRSSDGGQTYDADTLDFLPIDLRATASEILLADLGLSFKRSTDAVGISSDKTTRRSDFSMQLRETLFNTALQIKCTLPAARWTEVSIWSLDGRLVTTIHKGVCDKGTHSFTWNGCTANGKIAPSGIYFISMDVEGEDIPAKKVVKLK